MSMLTIRLFGACEVLLAGALVTNFRAVKNQVLLAYLASHADRPLARAQLAGLLWPDQPEKQALLNLRQALFRLRNLLGNDQATPPFLQIDTTTVHFDRRSDYWLDTAAFQALLTTCDHHARTSGDPIDHRRGCGACAQRLAQAVDLYRGDFMPGIYLDDSPALEEWLLLQRESFQHQALTALYDLAVWYEGQGDYARADDYARRQLALDPLREEAHRQRMRALALAGQRSAALAHYETCSQLLYTELGAPPAPETTALMQAIDAGTLTTAHQPAPVAARLSVTSLPTSGTTFIGREVEGEQLRRALLDPTAPLVTLVGPGGVGKTRVALAAAADLAGAFADGLIFVPLAGVETEAGLIGALVGALAFTLQATPAPWSQLLAYVQNRELLLILDNFEQLMTAAARVADLIAHAPRLKLLVTSRERLNFQQELSLLLAGLPLPPPAATPEASLRFSSVQLFLERAGRAGRGITPTTVDLPAVAAICRLVDGLPLGIELAAGWAEHYRCAEIAQAIAANLDFLQSAQRDRPPRQRSLRAVFTYSWQLLVPAEQRALAQMTVFRGAFSRQAAAIVAQVALPQLAALVDKSLVRVVAPGRYLFHELVRQFASEANSGDITEVAARHARYYLRLVAEQEGLFGAQPQAAVDAIMAEIENVRHAWQWAVAHRLAPLLTAAITNLARTFALVGLYREAAATWQLALTPWSTHSDPLPPSTAAWVSQLAIEAARTQNILGDHAQALAYATLALAQAAVAPDPKPLQTAAHQQLGMAHYRQGDHAAALPVLHQAVHIAELCANDRLLADTLLSLGEVQMYQGDEAGRAAFTRALTLYRQVGDRRGEGAARNSLALFAQLQSDFAQAQVDYEAALRIHRTLGDRHNEAITLSGLAGVYAKRGNFADADHALQQTLQLARAVGYRIGEVHALNSLGVNQMHQGKLAVARAYYEQALPIARQSAYLRGEGALLNNLGNLASDEGAYAQAEAYYRAALAVAQQSGDRYYGCGRLHNIGNMRRFQGDYGGAQGYYQEAVTVAAAIGDRWIEGSARTDLALACAFLCDQAGARLHAERALTLAQAIGDHWCAGKALSLLGWLTVVAGDHAGVAQIEAAITLAQQAAERGVEGAAYARYGFVHLLAGDAATALDAFSRSLQLRRASGDRVQSLTAQAGLALAQLGLGQPRAALAEVALMLQQIGDQWVGVADDPLRVYQACIQVLAAVEDPRAPLLRQRALAHMAAQADQIAAPAQREQFIAHYQQALQAQHE